VSRDGDAYVDLSTPPPEVVQGTDGELVLGLCDGQQRGEQLPRVRRVQILLGGRQVATLGHLDLSRPLAPNMELVAP